MVSIFITMYLMPAKINMQYGELINFLCPSVLLFSCYFLIYPAWSPMFKNKKTTNIISLFGLFYILIIAAVLFVMISNFSQNQLMIFFVDVIIISMIFRWHAAILMIVAGIFCSVSFFKYYSGMENIATNIEDIEFKIVYVALLVSSTLVAFVKPAQQNIDKKMRLFSQAEYQMKDMSQQMLDLLIMKQEFVNNLNHEIRTPIHQIGASAYAIKNDWNLSSESQKKEHADIIYDGYKRMLDYMDSLLDLSLLSTNKIQLKYSDINFYDLVQESFAECKNLYLDNYDLHFNINCEAANVIARCDREKISQVIKHLIKNAIDYTAEGVIEINVTNTDCTNYFKTVPGIKFSVTDEGIGIPENEILYIFGPFIQSSYTKKMSSGRGLGLALSEKIIQMHRGLIWAKNNKSRSGSTFSFIIPL
jgi:signal transduction histidine kinase